MIYTMDAFELKFYKKLPLHERINDKQEQIVFLAKMDSWENMEVAPEYAKIMPRRIRTVLNKLTGENAPKPY